MQTNDRAAWLNPNQCSCSVPAAPQKNPTRLVLLGPPGVGKGTQAELLCRHFAACHLSTGDIFRAAASVGENLSPAMQCALQSMRKGELVSDQTVLAIIGERAGCFKCGGGFLLDGFPRTVAQAKTLEEVLARQNVSLDAVINYALPISEIVERLSGRRTCMKCKAVFHVANRPPKIMPICDHCGSLLQVREDDKPQAIRVRMEAYQQSTGPLLDYYRSRDLLITITADGPLAEIFNRTVQALNDSLLAAL